MARISEQEADLLNEVVVQARDFLTRIRATYDVGDLDDDIDESAEELERKLGELDEFLGNDDEEELFDDGEGDCNDDW